MLYEELEYEDALFSRDAAAPTIIVIGQPEVATQIARMVTGVDFVAFRSVEDLERWRLENVRRRGDIRTYVAAALDEIGHRLEQLSHPLRTTFEWLGRHSVTPKVTELERTWSSRRSFYRKWGEEVVESPSSFCRRVRALHAERLIHGGTPLKKAALWSGFSSVDRMRRHLAGRERGVASGRVRRGGTD